MRSSLTEENSNDLERIQNSAERIMLGSKYTHYEDTLERVDIQSLRERRDELYWNFSK